MKKSCSLRLSVTYCESVLWDYILDNVSQADTSTVEHMVIVWLVIVWLLAFWKACVCVCVFVDVYSRSSRCPTHNLKWAVWSSMTHQTRELRTFSWRRPDWHTTARHCALSNRFIVQHQTRRWFLPDNNILNYST